MEIIFVIIFVYFPISTLVESSSPFIGYSLGLGVDALLKLVNYSRVLARDATLSSNLAWRSLFLFPSYFRSSSLVIVVNDLGFIVLLSFFQDTRILPILFYYKWVKIIKQKSLESRATIQSFAPNLIRLAPQLTRLPSIHNSRNKPNIIGRRWRKQ